MIRVPKISLADRLRQAETRGEGTACPRLFQLRTDAYFAGLDSMFGGSAYADTLYVVLGDNLRVYRSIPAVARFVAESVRLSDMEQSQLLYQTLVRPYAELQKETERSDSECLSLPF